MGGAAGVANLVRKGLEPLDAPRRERHGCAVRCQGPGEVPAEAARCPGHERGAAGQVECQSLLHSRLLCIRRPGIAGRPWRDAAGAGEEKSDERGIKTPSALRAGQ